MPQLSDPIMDGHHVVVGDAVYDVLHGSGEVFEILVDKNFRVRFGAANVHHTYGESGHGVRYRARTLFWHNPIIAVPSKTDTGWQKIREICTAVVNTLRV